MEKKVFRKVLEEFTRNTSDGIVSGHPKHPHTTGRYVRVTPAVADILAEDGLIAKTNSAEPEEEDQGGPESAPMAEDLQNARVAGQPAVASADDARRAKPATRGAGRKASTAKRSGKTEGPAGGSNTTATTNHGRESGAFVGGENGGQPERDPDAPPTT